MSYSFKPMSDEELDAFDLLEAGIYDFEVLSSESKTSSSGNPMAKVMLKVYDKKGAAYCIFDYLVFSSVKLCMRKIKHFCESAGIIDEYKNGNVREDLKGLSGKVKIKIEQESTSKDGKIFPKRNVVDDYVLLDNTKQSNDEKIEGEPFLNEDIPF